MKLYRVKPEFKKYLSVVDKEYEQTWECWDKWGLSMEALEEVEQRVELQSFAEFPDTKNCLRKTTIEPFTEAERIGCEAFCNGELFTKDQLLHCLVSTEDANIFNTDTAIEMFDDWQKYYVKQ